MANRKQKAFGWALIMVLATFLQACGSGGGGGESSGQDTGPNKGYIAGGQSNMTRKIDTTVGEYFAGFMASAGVPVHVFETAIGGTQLNSWMVGGENFAATVAPLKGKEIQGVLWWQGEGDACDATSHRVELAATYKDRLTKMIGEWREYFGGEVPFYVVQLETQPTDGNCHADGWPERWKMIQDAQAEVASTVPCVKLITITDITFGQTHPTYAYPEVGRRLAEAALKP